MQSQRRLDIRTLMIASVASAAAAALTSQFWIKGTPIAAAVTPVIVALISEMLHRPTERISQRLVGDAGPLPEAAGATGSPPREDEAGDEAAQRGAAPQAAADPRVRAYRSGRGRRFALGAALVTGALAFSTAALALSVPELITGSSLFNSDRRTTLGGAKLAPRQEPAPSDSDRTAPRPAPDGDRRTGEPGERRREQRPRQQQQQQRQQQQQQQQQQTTPETTPPPTTSPDAEEAPSSRTLDPSETVTPGVEAEPVLR